MLLQAVTDVEDNQKATMFGYYVNDPNRYGVAEFDQIVNVVRIEKNQLIQNPIIFLFQQDGGDKKIKALCDRKVVDNHCDQEFL